MSGSMNPQTACMATQNHLGFQPGLFWDMSLPIDCKDLVYSAHTLKHSITGSDFLDLAWLIPDNPMSTKSITPTLIAVATVAMEETLVKWLWEETQGPHHKWGGISLPLPLNHASRRSPTNTPRT